MRLLLMLTNENGKYFMELKNYFSLFGNHPFFTRLRCWKSSPIDQKDEKAKTPQEADTTTLCNNSEAITPPVPMSRNTHQHLTPK